MEYGVLSIFLRDMEMIIRVQMLMCGKVSQENFVELTASPPIPNKNLAS